MFPSKMIPTNSPARFTTGLPELPPMMSWVATKLNGTLPSIARRLSTHRFGRSNGGRYSMLAARSYRPDTTVNGGTDFPFSSYPFTTPYDNRSVKVASG